MMIVNSNLIRRYAAIFMLCLLTLPLLSGCAGDVGGNTKNIVYCFDNTNTSYPKVLSQILPSYTVEQTNVRAFAFLDEGAVSEAYDPHAVSALQTGNAKYWYPQYLATVVIAVDRDKTDAKIESWRDLTTATDEEVGIGNIFNVSGRLGNQMLPQAIAYGLEGEGYTLDGMAELLHTLQHNNRFVVNSFEPPIVICYDFQAAEQIKNGRNFEVIVPSDGTLTFERGLLSTTELTFTADVDEVLLTSGFRLLDGRCDPALYPGAAAYENASRITDYDHLSKEVFDTLRTVRRDIFHLRLYGSADGREHQYAILIFIIILVMWTASLMNRIADKNIRRAVLVAGFTMLCWMITRLITYQMVVYSTARRYVWFSFNLWQLILPLVLLYVAYVIGKTDDKTHFTKWMWALVAYAGLVTILTFTNDFHMLVFPMDLSSLTWHSDYGYGIGHDMFRIGTYLPSIAAIIILLKKSLGNVRKLGLIFPVAFTVLLTIYQNAFNARVQIAYETDRTTIICLFVLLFAESLIWTGLIPVNTKYKALFTSSPLGMRINDNGGNMAWASATAVQYKLETIENALNSYPMPVRQGDNALLFAAPITGGYTLWQEDISKLTRLHKEISETVSNLKTANAMLAQEEKVKQSTQEEYERTQLLSQLEGAIAAHITKLPAMVEEMGNLAEPARAIATARILLLLCYVKRRSNLLFLEREAVAMPSDEFNSLMDELARVTHYKGDRIIVTSELRKPVSIRRAALFYDCFYHFIDWAAGLEKPLVHAYIAADDQRIVLRLNADGDAREMQPDKDMQAAILSANGIYEVTDIDDDDGTYGIRLTFPEGGAADV